MLGLVAVWVLLLAAPAWAADVSLTVEPRALVTDQTARMRILVTGVQPMSIPDVSAPAGTQVGYTGQHTTVRSGYGSGFTRTVAFEYALHVVTPGTFTIGPVDVEITGAGGPAVVSTNAVTVTVEERKDRPQTPKIFAEAGFDVADAWEGQVVLYHYRLESRVRLMDSPNWQLPAFDGLRAPRDGNRPHKSYVVDDPEGAIHVTEGFIPLVATGTGQRDQLASVVRVNVAVDGGGRRGPFDLLPTFKRHAVATEPATLNIAPLPPAPADFSGLVGEFDFDSHLDRDVLRVGESADWTLAVRGTGSLEGLDLPEPEVEGVRFYDSGAQVSGQVLNGAYQATGAFRRVIVATAEGVVDPPPLTFSTFSPDRAEYVSHTIDLPPIQVVEGGDTTASVESFADGRDLPTAGESQVYDLRPIHTWGLASVWYLGGILPWLIGLAAVPGLGVAGLELAEWGRATWTRWRSRTQAPPRASRLLRHLPEARQERLAALDGALRLVLANHAGVAVEHLDRAAVLASLPDELATRIRAVGDALDRARFAELELDPADEVRAVVAAVEAL